MHERTASVGSTGSAGTASPIGAPGHSLFTCTCGPFAGSTLQFHDEWEAVRVVQLRDAGRQLVKTGRWDGLAPSEPCTISWPGGDKVEVTRDTETKSVTVLEATWSLTHVAGPVFTD